MTNKKIASKAIFSLALVVLAFSGRELFAWSSPIRVIGTSGTAYYKPVVAYAPGGKTYVVYQAGRNIHLSSYNGSSVAFEKNISETSLIGYEAFMFINRRGYIHIVWIEASSYDSDTQYVKYRYYNGSSWSAVSTLRTLTITGVLPGGYVTRKVEDLRIAADENNNVFIAFMIWPAARCQFISKYGSTIREEAWPMTGRSKHPDVSVDSNYVHVAWQQLWGSNYTIAYSRRSNSSGASWGADIDVKDGNHRPRLCSDPTRLLHIIMMNDYNIGVNRDTYYKYWTGSGFSSRFLISNDGARAYHEINVSALSSENIFVSEWAGNTIYFNWKQNGRWTGHKKVPAPGIAPGFTSSALSSGGQAAIAVANSTIAVYLITSQGESPDPNPPGPEPEPDPDPNKPPTAFFSFTPTSGLYPLAVSFNAGNSKDSDGQITSYHWDFGDGASGSGKTVNHVYSKEGRFEITLRVTDDDSASATATGEVEVLGIAPPLNVQFQSFVNRNLFSIEYLYRVTWNSNPRNEEVGAKIVAYKVYRREIGKGGFSHFYTLQVGSQSSSYEYLDRSLGSSARSYEYAISALDGGGRESNLGY
jgi:PKD repeat protein